MATEDKKATLQQYFSFVLIRVLTFPLTFLPYSALHALGSALGKAAYYLLPKFRKRTLSNLALTGIAGSEEELVHLAQASIGNLMITCLEYPKLAAEKEIAKVATCLNPEKADAIMKTGQGVIFFCGHQANWEILFLEGTARMPGVAIGRPIKNPLLYDWILSIREKFGGKIITRQNAIKEGLRGLKQGAFLGIVGDQGMPDSGYRSPFLGRQAWTSPVPALLSYRTGSPLIVATTSRKNGKYHIRYSEPIWPNKQEDMEKEIDRLMRACLTLFEKSVKEEPAQWMWQHNRWKQQTPEKLKPSFRHDTLCILLPEQRELFENIWALLPTFREIYPHESITVKIPRTFSHLPLPIDAEKTVYDMPKDLFVRDFRFKLVFNFSGIAALKSHFLKLAAFTVVDWRDLQARETPLSGQDLLQHVLRD
jgi:KDO2-lipid IV(A) lauroyltransferase